MPLGLREVLLVIRAKDQASRVIRDVGLAFDSVDKQAEAAAKGHLQAGAALMGIGLGIGAIGVAGLAVTKNWIDAAKDYNQQAALTMTQIDQVGVTLDQVKDIGRTVAAVVPVPFEETQTALYDIFSSMNVTVDGAKALLMDFSKTSVAGQVSLQDAAKSTIAIMNAWKLPVEDVTHVQDVMFQLVRKGVGTYGEFASSIGRAIPSAVKAGQSIESLAGMMAFLTRNGLSTSQATTSAARALDNLTNPKFIENMGKIGLSVFDASGNVRSMVSIAGDLSASLEGMTSQQRIDALNSLFEGAGNNIQARRFWDLALQNFSDLNDLTGEMVDSSGALGDAYDIMFGQPASQSQLLQNNLDILSTTMGDALLPVFNDFLGLLISAVQWFNNLDPSVKELIAKIVLFGSIILVAIGALLALAGAFLMIWGAIELIGGFAAVISGALILVGVLAALAGLAYLVYRNWDTLKGWWDTAWPKMKDLAIGIWDAIKGWWDKNWPAIRDKAIEIWDVIKEKWGVLWDGIKDKWNEFWDWFSSNWPGWWDSIKTKAMEVWDWLQENVPQILDNTKQAISDFSDQVATDWDTVRTATETAWTAMGDSINDFTARALEYGSQLQTQFGPGVVAVWQSIYDNVGPLMSGLWTITIAVFGGIALTIKTALDLIWGYFMTFKDTTLGLWNTFHTELMTIASAIWTAIGGVIAGAISIITGIIDGFASLITGNWTSLWENIHRIAQGALQIITSILSGEFAIMGALFSMFQTVASGAWSMLWNALSPVMSNALDIIKSILGAAWSALIAIVDSIKAPIQGVIDIIGRIGGAFQAAADAAASAAERVKSAAQSILSAAASAANPIGAIGSGVAGILGFASGGGMNANSAYIINEKGPELFVPRVAGRMYSSSDISSMLNAGMSESPDNQGNQVVVQEGAVSMTFNGTNNAEEVRVVVQEEFGKLLTAIRKAA